MSNFMLTIAPSVLEASASPRRFIDQLWARWAGLPSQRQPNNITRYTMGDAAMSAFAVFFLQRPSFLARQRAWQTWAGPGNLPADRPPFL
jgi:hypothetical protein